MFVLVTKRIVHNARNRTYDVYGHNKVQNVYFAYIKLTSNDSEVHYN